MLDWPGWVDSGILPLIGRQAGQSWHELAMTASQLQTAEDTDRSPQSPKPDEGKTKKLWNAAAGMSESWVDMP